MGNSPRGRSGSPWHCEIDLEGILCLLYPTCPTSPHVWCFSLPQRWIQGGGSPTYNIASCLTNVSPTSLHSLPIWESMHRGGWSHIYISRINEHQSHGILGHLNKISNHLAFSRRSSHRLEVKIIALNTVPKHFIVFINDIWSSSWPPYRYAPAQTNPASKQLQSINDQQLGYLLPMCFTLL